jgi:hypothetical protein
LHRPLCSSRPLMDANQFISRVGLAPFRAGCGLSQPRQSRPQTVFSLLSLQRVHLPRFRHGSGIASRKGGGRRSAARRICSAAHLINDHAERRWQRSAVHVNAAAVLRPADKPHVYELPSARCTAIRRTFLPKRARGRGTRQRTQVRRGLHQQQQHPQRCPSWHPQPQERMQLPVS